MTLDGIHCILYKRPEIVPRVENGINENLQHFNHIQLKQDTLRFF